MYVYKKKRYNFLLNEPCFFLLKYSVLVFLLKADIGMMVRAFANGTGDLG